MNIVRITDADQLSEIIERSLDKDEPIFLATDGQPKAVLLSLETFESLIGIDKYRRRQLMSIDSLQKQLQADLNEAGYNSREKIVALVQEVKQEMAAEREHQSIVVKAQSEKHD